MLEINDLTVSYGEITALDGISLSVKQGEIVTVIGANGAGKSTLLRCISGLVRATSGTMSFGAASIRAEAPQNIVRLGIAHVPEGRHVFPELSVLDNLKVGGYLNTNKHDREADVQQVFKMFPKLEQRSRQHAGTLSGGEQQMLALGRAVMTRPKMLLLDEPSLGLAPQIVDEVLDAIERFRDEGLTILLVEQNASLALAIADRAYVMTLGRISISGTAAEILANPEVQSSYLGVSEETNE